MTQRIPATSRLLKVRLAPKSESTIRATVFAVSPSGDYERYRLDDLDPARAADLVRDLVTRQPSVAVERAYSRWDGPTMRPWPMPLWEALANEFRERELVPVPVEVVPDDDGEPDVSV